MGQSKTSKFYASNPVARKKRQKAQAEINKKPEQVKYRVELNKANRKAGTYGNGDGIDMSHTKKDTLVKEKASTNRARNGHGKNKSTKK